MWGFRTPDDVVYLADWLSSREVLEEYQIGFIYDVAACLKTLEMVKSLRAKIFVPAHAAAFEDVTDKEVTCYLRPLHELVMKGSCEFGKEESLILLVSLLVQEYGQPFESCIPECREEIEKA